MPAPTVTTAAKPPGALSAPGIEAPGEEPPADLPMPAGVSPTPATPPMPNAAATAATAPAMPVAATAATTAAATPAAATTAASKTPDAKGKTPAGKNGEPSEAEKAIVQNAAVLDQLSPNNNRPFDPNQAAPDQSASVKTIDQLLSQPAIVRPLPPAWLTVRKERASDDVDTHLTVAREALAQNNNTAALQLFTALKEKYPKDKRILMGRAVALQKLNQDDAALSAYEAVLNNDPKNLEALTNMLGLLKKKDPKLAVAKLEQLRDAYPYNADITAQLGVACGAAGQYEDALRYLNMADALNPGSAYIVYNKAVLYDRMGQSHQAGDLYREVIRMASDGDLTEALPLDAIKRRLAVLH
jgi:tetratricopeptide (TPR) repeat protein